MAKQTVAIVKAVEGFDPDMTLETSIGSRDPNGKTFQCRLGDFPQAAIEKFLRYGFQRVFNDATGGSDTTVEQKVTEAAAMIERFKNGEIGRVGSASADSVTSLARTLARAKIKSQNPDAAKRLREAIKTGGKIREDAWAKIDAIIEKNPQILEDAKAELKRRNETVATIDLGNVEL